MVNDNILVRVPNMAEHEEERGKRTQHEALLYTLKGRVCAMQAISRFSCLLARYVDVPSLGGCLM